MLCVARGLNLRLGLDAVEKSPEEVGKDDDRRPGLGPRPSALSKADMDRCLGGPGHEVSGGFGLMSRVVRGGQVEVRVAVTSIVVHCLSDSG
jgi:hypothetical protein